MQIAYRSEYHHLLPEGHRFPMVKYELIPRQLVYEGTLSESQFFKPEPVDEQWILTVHTPEYWEQLKNLSLPAPMIRRIGFPLDEGLVFRETVIVQGTIDCALHAFQYGIALNVAGGTHHAYADKGEGFCLLNDMAVAARYLLDKGLVKQVMIVDLDVHQGNGTASIFADEPRVFTFSMHGQENYPLRKELSDLDIALPTGCEDESYLSVLYETLPHLLEAHRPDFVFYLSGVDVIFNDKLGKLSLTIDGMKKRDEFVFEQCMKRGIPVTVAMGGGYSSKLSDIVEAHCNTFRIAARLYGH